MSSRPCATPGCVAFAVNGSALCSVCVSYMRRASESAAIHCYACGDLIRIGARWMVRSEGAFHARDACLKTSAERYAIPVLPASIERVTQ